MENQKTHLSDRSVLIMTQPKGVMWVRLPSKRMPPLTKKVLRLYPPKPLKVIEHCVTWTPIFAALNLEVAAVLWLRETLRQIGVEKKSVEQNAPLLKAIIDVSNGLFSFREQAMANGPLGIRHIRQAMYWVDDNSIKTGYNIQQGFFVDNKLNTKLESLATYMVRVNDQPVIGLWESMPAHLAAKPPPDGKPKIPKLLDIVGDTGVRH